VQLVGISMGDARVPGVVKSDLRLDLFSGRGGVIMDSCTSVTCLTQPTYPARKKAVEKDGQTKDMAKQTMKRAADEVVLLLGPTPSGCPYLRILLVRIC
jgi:hypothetical protein